jgi:DNA-binding transcriptional LysR family regulator
MTDFPAFNLKRAYYFVVLAEELHFGRAAKRLFIAGPGLSQQIKILETELGVRLIERYGRETRLTPAGELFYQEATDLIRHAADLVERVQARSHGRECRLTVGYSHSTQYFETELVDELRARRPEIQVSTTTAWTVLNLEMLRTHNADVVFVRPPVDEPDIEVLTLLSEEIVVALPPSHRLSDQLVISAGDLADEDVVMWPRKIAPSHYDRVVGQVWGPRRPKVVLEELDDQRRLMAVADGVGICLLGREIAEHLAPERVAIRRFADPAPTRYLGVAWRRGDDLPNVQAFLAICLQRCPLARTN